ncbi:glucose-1-phosphate thymidylyltransferase RfbA [Flavobacteriaceae bacterium]|nr:glucose-1-phosphate thymidylyltransferase RfbA [Flavobacteriaceae bacterium]MDB4113039.1 glucose-1-phosphate thymidylyltransferase RfbA [Flavobacteriaceae bacterium]MDB4118021.1 glucose-1-phosphate thymidylyltransferase RfbA [Flavobacteriaceae bacterium]MDB4187446.1 glucose-1-phosphate thymidylyltransferase RfbA [Flavobacteriaceae bacterium]MDB9885845.1 glucose-1-phosphate thymidylyltransferase RfbA [Flavobacteriaceae bacterium]
MKGIVLAGGNGTRLHPLTLSVSKQLMPIYDKPMIYYPLSTLIAAGIHEILIISTPEDLPLFERLLGDGSQWGCAFSYAEQAEPKGLAEAFIIGESFIGESSVALILGDNLFHGGKLSEQLAALDKIDGGHVFAYQVKDPERYGVVAFDTKNRIISLEEKPEQPKSSFAVPGIYFYDNTVVQKAKNLRPSKRGELEITDINKSYLAEQMLRLTPLEVGSAWLDTGTIESLMEASQYVQALQSRQGVLVGSPEVAAYTSKAISLEQLLEIANKMTYTPYGEAIKSLATR